MARTDANPPMPDFVTDYQLQEVDPAFLTQSVKPGVKPVQSTTRLPSAPSKVLPAKTPPVGVHVLALLGVVALTKSAMASTANSNKRPSRGVKRLILLIIFPAV